MKQVNSSENKQLSVSRLYAGLCHFLGLFLIAAVLGFAAAMVFPTLGGLDMYNLLQGSDDPAVPAGSLLYVRQMEASELKAGDIIAYRCALEDKESELPGQISVGVLINNTGEDGFVLEITTGTETTEKISEDDDENGNIVQYADIYGKVISHIPMLGQFMTIYSSIPGRVCLLFIVLCGVMLNFVAFRIKDNAAEKEKYGR